MEGDRALPSASRVAVARGGVVSSVSSVDVSAKTPRHCGGSCGFRARGAGFSHDPPAAHAACAAPAAGRGRQPAPHEVGEHARAAVAHVQPVAGEDAAAPTAVAHAVEQHDALRVVPRGAPHRGGRARPDARRRHEPEHHSAADDAQRAVDLRAADGPVGAEREHGHRRSVPARLRAANRSTPFESWRLPRASASMPRAARRGTASSSVESPTISGARTARDGSVWARATSRASHACAAGATTTTARTVRQTPNAPRRRVP